MAWGEGSTDETSTMRPSAFETIFCATTSTSPSSRREAGFGIGGERDRGEVVARLDQRHAGEAGDRQLGGHSVR